MKIINSQNDNSLQRIKIAALYERNIWEAEEIGFLPNTTHGSYHLNFNKLEPNWFRHAVKQFIHFQAATRSFASCYSYIVQLNQFSRFLSSEFPEISPSGINRDVIIKYIAYLATSGLSVTARSMALIHLRTFHGILIQEKWLPWPKEPIIYSSDFPRKHEHVPRFIPEYVISQLMKNTHHLPEYIQNFVIVLLETGRRIGEICTLPVNCMEKDEEGSYFLRVRESKLKKTYLIPVSESCVKAIKKQQDLIARGEFKNRDYLFSSRGRLNSKSPHVTPRHVNRLLHDLAYKCKILDEQGNTWNFHSHQFRHTVGTRMINAGVPQAIVQKYLGHESPEMTARYAHIHNKTLKKAFHEYQEKLIDIHGKPLYRSNKDKDAKWLQHNTMAQALPNGICGLPSPQQRCPHANACLTCVHFSTHRQFLPQHNNQLDVTNKIIETAKTNGWQRQLEMNLAVKKNLECATKAPLC